MNAYDLEHACTGHPLMSKEAWQKVYADAWTRYYTDEHVETILRRAAASGLRLNKLRHLLTVFAGSARIEGVHPLQFGIFRRKVRTQRRAGMPILSRSCSIRGGSPILSGQRCSGRGCCGAIIASWRG